MAYFSRECLTQLQSCSVRLQGLGPIPLESVLLTLHPNPRAKARREPNPKTPIQTLSASIPPSKCQMCLLTWASSETHISGVYTDRKHMVARRSFFSSGGTKTLERAVLKSGAGPLLVKAGSPPFNRAHACTHAHAHM